MKTFTAYRSTTGQAFRTPETCLHAEFADLRKSVIAYAQALILLPHVDLDRQFQALQEKIDLWYGKGVEYHDALKANEPNPVRNLKEFRAEYQDRILKTGTDNV